MQDGEYKREMGEACRSQS